MIMRSVDLPEPEGPTSPTVSPRPMLKLTPLENMDSRRAASEAQMHIFEFNHRFIHQCHPISILKPLAAKPVGARRIRRRDRSRLDMGTASAGSNHELVSLFTLLCSVPLLAFLSSASAAGTARVVKLIAFGDSLSVGYMLPPEDAFPAALEAALRKEGYACHHRQCWSFRRHRNGRPRQTGLDFGRRRRWRHPGVRRQRYVAWNDPSVTKGALEAIVAELKARNVKVLIAGHVGEPQLQPRQRVQGALRRHLSGPRREI